MEKLHKILSDNWAMRRQDFEALLAMIIPGLINGNLEGVSKLISEGQPKIMAAVSDGINVADYADLIWDEVQPNSVLVIPMRGYLYSWTTEWLIRVIKRAEANPNVIGLVLDIDGPGGMGSHVERAAKALRDFSKPSATVVTHYMASAHFWIGTATDRIYCASPLCEIGSVGVLVTYATLKEFFKKNGIKIWNIYPDTSDLKNKEIRALEDKEDDSLIKEHAEKLHRAFSEAVAMQLGVNYDPELPLFRGEMFSGADALALGYIQEIAEVDAAINWVALQAQIREANNFYNS